MSLYIELEKINNNLTAKQENAAEKAEKKELEKMLFNYFYNYFNEHDNQTPEDTKKHFESLVVIERIYKNAELTQTPFYKYNETYTKQLEKVYKMYNKFYKNQTIEEAPEEDENTIKALELVKNSVIYNLNKINCYSDIIYNYKEIVIQTAAEKYNIKDTTQLSKAFDATCKQQRRVYKYKEETFLYNVERITRGITTIILLIILISIMIIL